MMESNTDPMSPDMEDEAIHDQLPDVEEYKAGLAAGDGKPDPDGAHNTFNYAAGHGKGRLYNSDDIDLEEAGLMDLNKGTPYENPWCRRSMWCCFICLAIASFVVLIVSLATEDQPVSSTQNWERPSMRFTSTKSYLVENRVSSAEDLGRSDSPQHLAAKWIANGDEMRLPIPQKPTDLNGNRDDWTFIERYVLAVFYFATGGPNWKFQLNFLSPNHVCAWYETFEVENANIDILDQDTLTMGVHGCIRDESTDDELVPYALFIPNNNLVGTLPGEIEYLRRVVSYDLIFNKDLGGPLPNRLANMPWLRHLGLQYGSFSGTIPSEIGGLVNLNYLGLGNNNLTGTIPTEIASLSNLRLLGLDDNGLSGKIDILSSLTSLRSLYLEDNAFTGELSMAVMVSWPDLQELDISSNSLTGTIGNDFFSDFNDLMVLDLSSNSFTGTLPDPALDNFEMEYLAVDDNAFSGNISNGIFKFKKVKHLGLSGNRFSGTIPELLGFMTSLEYLFIGENLFEEGPIPNSLSEFSNLRDLSLKDCDLTGTIPDWIGSLTNLELLDFHFNKLTGPIPKSIGDLTNMKHLLFKQNNLSGTVPAEFDRLTNLQVLLLEQNNFVGGAEAVCNSEDFNLVYFVSDCDGGFSCECCNLCCTPDDNTCNAGYWDARIDPIWEYGFKRDRYEYNFGPPESTGLTGE